MDDDHLPRTRANASSSPARRRFASASSGGRRESLVTDPPEAKRWRSGSGNDSSPPGHEKKREQVRKICPPPSPLATGRAVARPREIHVLVNEHEGYREPAVDGRIDGVKLKLDLHEIYNRSGDIDRALRAIIDEAVAKKAPLVEIIPGKGSGQLKKRVLRFLDQKEIKALYHRVEKDSDNFGRVFVHFRWK
jgi:hypothetical protein